MIKGDSPVCAMELEDISSEIAYWKNSVVCYVLGAHPPFLGIKWVCLKNVEQIWNQQDSYAEKWHSIGSISLCDRTN